MIQNGQSRAPEGSTMRRLMIAIAIAFVAVVGVKQIFFSPSTAMPTASIVMGSGIDVAKLHLGSELPVQRPDDMTFVATGSD
jgi:hypothetical protein